MAILKFGGKNTPEGKIRICFPIIFLFDQKPIHKKILSILVGGKWVHHPSVMKDGVWDSPFQLLIDKNHLN